METSSSVIFLTKWGWRGHWGHQGCWGCGGHWGCKGSKARKITTDDCRVIQVPEFSFILMFWKQIFFVRMTDCTLHIKWFPWHQEPIWPQWPQKPQQPQWPQWHLQPHFIKKNTELDFSINPGTKTTNSGLIMGVGSSKTQCFLDFDILSFGGCGGQGCYLNQIKGS